MKHHKLNMVEVEGMSFRFAYDELRAAKEWWMEQGYDKDEHESIILLSAAFEGIIEAPDFIDEGYITQV